MLRRLTEMKCIIRVIKTLSLITYRNKIYYAFLAVNTAFVCLFIYLYSCRSHLKHRASVKRFVSLQFLKTVGRIPWMGDKPVARPLPTQDDTDTINADRYSCLEWDSNPRSPCPSGRRQFMP
jgi:hypothetical protein